VEYLSPADAEYLASLFGRQGVSMRGSAILHTLFPVLIAAVLQPSHLCRAHSQLAFVGEVPAAVETAFVASVDAQSKGGQLPLP